MSLREKFGYGNLETLQFLWTNKGGVFLHRKWGKDIPKPIAHQNGSALQSANFQQKKKDSALLTSNQCLITGCESKLRTLREAAPHHPMLRSFLKTLYEAIRSHKMIASIDSALRTGKFASLALWCGIKYYRKLFSSEHKSNSTDTNCESKPTVDIQRPNLPDVESGLQVKHAQMIAELEKKTGRRSQVCLLQLRAAASEKECNCI